MIKTILLPCSIILLICALSSVGLNYQSPSPAKKTRDFLDFLNEEKNQMNWAETLIQLPQYRKLGEVKTEPEIIKEQQISDSQVIGIVVDEPKSALLLIHTEDGVKTKHLLIGEQWLENWKIQVIEPDSITWFNVLTRQSYIQTLFVNESNQSKTGTK